MCHRFGNVEWAHHAHKYKHPGVALKVFVLGPPQCGKTQLCSLLEAKTQPNSPKPWLKSESWQLSKILLNFPHIVNQVFDYAEASTPGGSSVSSSFFSDSGSAEDRMNDLTHCVITSLRTSEQKHCGWILENFPRSVVQLKIMAEEGMMPHCVVNVEGPSPEESDAQELLLHRERQAVLSELQLCGIKIITVSPPVLSRTKSDSIIIGIRDQSRDQSSSLPLKRTASGSSILSACAATALSRTVVVHSLIEQTCAGIASFLHSTAVPPYAVAFPLQIEKRCSFCTRPFSIEFN
jgi:adenylate kinase family enzyme